nr:glutathione S-transferase sigma 8-2 [Brachionus rubens]
MASYKLVYFDLKGRAEAIRILFKLANQPFEDKRIEFSEWPELKSKTPFHKLPMLEFTENSRTQVIPQSNSIVRFVAERFGLCGANDLEKAQCDAISEQVRDIFDSLVNIYLIKDNDEKNRSLDKALSESVPNGFKLIQNILESNQSGFLVGDKITYADVVLLISYEWLRDRKDEVLAKLPALKKHNDMICSIPVIAKHLEENKNVRLTILF